jgi:hypothetical protein
VVRDFGALKSRSDRGLDCCRDREDLRCESSAAHIEKTTDQRHFAGFFAISVETQPSPILALLLPI